MSKSILDVISNLRKMLHLTPASDFDVLNAEYDLGVKFADDFKEYVLEYGVITAENVEITGVCTSERLSVVYVTAKERKLNPAIPDDMYVIDSTGYEGLVVLQNSQGEIFSLGPSSTPKKIFNSLADYLEDLQKN